MYKIKSFYIKQRQEKEAKREGMTEIICFGELSFEEDILFDIVCLYLRFQNIEVQILQWKYQKFLKEGNLRQASINIRVKVPYECQKCTIFIKPSIINLPINTQAIALKLKNTCVNHFLNFNTQLGLFKLSFQKKHETYVPLNIDNEISASTFNQYDQMQEYDGLEKQTHQEDKTRNEEIVHLHTRKKRHKYSLSEASLPKSSYSFDH